MGAGGAGVVVLGGGFGRGDQLVGHLPLRRGQVRPAGMCVCVVWFVHVYVCEYVRVLYFCACACVCVFAFRVLRFACVCVAMFAYARIFC